ncbi:uracil-DNA glycosylase [Streptomyces inhibens]|uniref:Uracil-DNA glycosylase n=1 Tax=Streptomyces inhibens TaxID=2293571 RepID=A0A371QB20_STRIH|nr:uracil-DNA glycosylase family protein [Streptomyces inhibens]REK91865.1 uracil-DNA glycosylase [Streptomyces inhibens]
MHTFDPGYGNDPYAGLVRDHPGPETYPPEHFRVEWGPIFHRGRLDGTARVLVIGQDPAAHEAITRRILVGTAGRRFQGFLAKLGIDTSYVMINTYLYSVYGQHSGNAHATDPDIAGYRHDWLDALIADNPIEAVIALGSLADTAFHTWRATPTGAAYTGAYQHILHPTYPDSAASSGTDPAKALAKLLTNWNAALQALHPTVTPETPRPLVPYGTTLTPDDLGTVPEADLPPGLPAWMRSDEPWASRQGSTPADKRATITVQVPAGARTF